jgi:putative nucleotidyltransferase with HDIG domain
MIDGTDFEKLFSELLSQITSESLRQKVVDAWLLASRRGGWESIEDIKKMPFTLLTDTKGISFIEHTIAVTKGALDLAKAQADSYSKLPYKIDYDRLIAGGLLHDVGKLLEIESDGAGGYRKSHSGKCARHPISGVVIVSEAGLSDEIVNIVACHAKEGEGRPQVIETILIHQSDFATFNPLVMLEKGQLITGE